MSNRVKIERVCWNITSLCNDDCQFCFRMLDFESLDLEDAIRVIEVLSINGIKHIAISGGEALLYEHIFAILEKIKMAGMELTLISNGILLTGETLERVINLVDWIALPLDTLMPYNKLHTRNPNHKDNILHVLDEIEQNATVKVKLNTVISAINYLEVEDIYEQVIEKYACIQRWNLFEFLPLRGNSKKNAKRFTISSVEEEAVLKQLDRINIGNRSLRIKYKHKGTLTRSYIVISPNGSLVKENMNTTEIIGNVLHDDFRSMIDKLDIDYRIYDRRTSNASIIII